MYHKSLPYPPLLSFLHNKALNHYLYFPRTQVLKDISSVGHLIPYRD